MEFLGGGSALDLLKPGPFDEASIAIILRSLLQGLNYLHNSGKIHRDLKAANILLSAHGDVKIADFGVATQLSNNLSRRNTFVGTPFWMAPEVIIQEDYGYEADVWSLGITAMEMAHGQPPLASVHPMKVLFLIPKNAPPKIGENEGFSKDFREFVDLCLKKRPAERASVSQLLKHRFIRNAGKKTHLLGLIERRANQKKFLSTKERIYQPTIDNVSDLVDDDGGWDFETVKRPLENGLAATRSVSSFASGATTPVISQSGQSSLSSTVKKYPTVSRAAQVSTRRTATTYTNTKPSRSPSPQEADLRPIKHSLNAAISRLSLSSNSITSASSNNANLQAAASFDRLLSAFKYEETQGLTPAMELYLIRKIIERVREVPTLNDILLGSSTPRKPQPPETVPAAVQKNGGQRDYIEDMLLSRWIEGLDERWSDRLLAESSTELDSEP